MPNAWDASVKLLYAVDENTYLTADTVPAGNAFDAIANVEIGKSLNGFATHHRVKLTVFNATTGTVAATAVYDETLTPTDAPHFQEIRVPVPPGWTGSDQDVLTLTCSYKVTAGIHTDYSHSSAGAVIVTV